MSQDLAKNHIFLILWHHTLLLCIWLPKIVEPLRALPQPYIALYYIGHVHQPEFCMP